MIFDFNVTIAPAYILNKIELEGKRYGLKHSIANLMDQPSCTLDAITVLNKNRWKQIGNEKVMAPQSKGGQKTPKKSIEAGS